MTSLHQVTPEEAKAHLEEPIKSALEGKRSLSLRMLSTRSSWFRSPAIHTIVSLGAARAHLP
jgi:hypothetical protein